MSENVIIKMLQEIPNTRDVEVLVNTLNDAFKNNDKVYSYLFRRKENNYLLQINLSQIDKYNTICKDRAIYEIINLVLNDDGSDKKVLGYNQPSIEIILEAFEPLVHKLAYKQQERWKFLEYEDLCQMCRMSMVKLYKKGFYLHKYLIEKAFINDVLISIRHERDKPVILSMHDVFYKPLSASSENLVFADILADKDQEIKEYDANVSETTLLIFEEVKDVVIDLIGVRQWNELFRDYGNKHTSSWSRKTMGKIKREFEKEGLTRGKFNDKYYK